MYLSLHLDNVYKYIIPTHSVSPCIFTIHIYQRNDKIHFKIGLTVSVYEYSKETRNSTFKYLHKLVLYIF